MAESRQCDAWDRVAILWQAVVETNRNPELEPRPYSPADVHPFRDRSYYEPDGDDMDRLETFLTRGGRRDGQGSN